MFYRFLCNVMQRASQKAKKYGANAPQLHPIRCSIDFWVMLCNETAFNPVQTWLSGFAALCRSTTTVGTASKNTRLPLLAWLAITSLCWHCIVDGKWGAAHWMFSGKWGHTTLTMTNHYASLSTEHFRKSQERFSPLRAKGGAELEGSSGGYWDE